MENMEVFLRTPDYVVLIIVIIVCTAIGLYSGRTNPGRKISIEQYLLGSRNMHVLPVAFSIMATNLSAVTMAGVAAEMYLYGLQYVIAFFTYSFGILVVAKLVVPIMHNYRYISIYEYMEKRYDRRLRLIYSISYLVGTTVFLGVVIYVPAVSLTVVSGLPTYVTILVIGISCTMYCVLGGFKAVIWTDVLQSILMLTTLVLFLIKGTIDGGGVKVVFEESISSGFLTVLSWYEDFNYRHSVLSVACMGLYYSLKDIVLNQAGAQRIFSVKDTRAAKTSSYLSFGLTFLFASLLGLCGIVLYVNFYKCNPLMFPRETGVKSIDQIFIYATVKFLSDWPGMSGLALSGILSGSISTISSYINAFAAITLEDYIKNFYKDLVLTEKRQVLICRVLTGIYGCLAMGFAFLIPLLGGALQAGISTLAVTAGPMCGVLLLGIFVRRSNSRTAFISLGLGIAICLTLQIGNLVSNPQYKTTNLGTSGCDFKNVSAVYMNDTGTSEVKRIPEKLKRICPLFKISFPLYGPIGLIASFISGYIISFCFEEENVDTKLLSSFVKQKKNRLLHVGLRDTAGESTV